MDSAKKEIWKMQRQQLNHDKEYHADILHLSKQDQLKGELIKQGWTPPDIEGELIKRGWKR